MPLPKERIYTIDDINDLPEGQLAELIEGKLYKQASPSKTHQVISSQLHFAINKYIESKKGKCLALAAPFNIFLNGEESECFIPDISIICNPDIIKERGCYGAPDWIIEITSPSTMRNDYLLKSFKYQEAGVKEYWIINPVKKASLSIVSMKKNFHQSHIPLKIKSKQVSIMILKLILYNSTCSQPFQLFLQNR